MMSGITNTRRVLTAFVVALAVALPPLFLIPLQIYAYNPYDFSAGFADLLPHLMMGAGIAAIVLFALLVFVPAMIYRVVVAVFVGVALGIWAQGQLMLWDYGVLDGAAIDWGANPWRILVDSALWLTVLAGAILARHWLVPRAWLVAAAVLLIQMVPAVQAWHSVPAQSEFHRYNLDYRHQFSFSSDRNVIIIVLDAFQSDIFHRIIHDQPEWSDQLDGFTYFRNALAGYSKTYPTLALMLSGEWYDNNEPIQQFIRRTFLDSSLPQLLKEKGWRVDLFPHVNRVVHVSPRVISNTVPSATCNVLYQEAGKLIDLGLFRVSPHWAKRYWLNEYRWRWASYLPEYCEADNAGPEQASDQRDLHHALRFLGDLQSDADAELETPAFKLYHLFVPHAPFQIDESLAMTQLPSGREGFMRQSVASMEIVRRFLAQLRQLDIYDQSTIAIVSDHGGGEYADEIDTDVLENLDGQASGENDEIPGSHLASGLALVLIKPPDARGELAISDAPVSLGDVAHTIAEIIGLSHNYPGENMFELSAGDERERRYHFYQFTGWTGEYLPAMTEYIVDGFSWFSGNWQTTGRVLEPDEQPDRLSGAEVRPGQIIRFHPDSPHVNIFGEGWSEPHSHGFVWSNARRAELNIPLDESLDGPLEVHFDFLPFTAQGAISSPRIEVVVNDGLIHVWDSEGRGWHSVRIPEAISEDTDVLNFVFHFPDGASPFEHGLSADHRTLGMALYRLKIERPHRGAQ